MAYKFPVIKRILKTAKELKGDPDIKDIGKKVASKALGSLAQETVELKTRGLIDKIGKKRKK